MNNLNIEAGPKTPFVNLDKNGIIELRGKSIPENSSEFYKPVYDWIDSYANSPNDSTKVILELEYFNTSSSKCILDILRKLEMMHNQAKSKVSVAWLYDAEDEDMLETGEDYSSIVKIPFVISAKSG